MNSHQPPPGTPGQPIHVNVPKNQTEVVPCAECGNGKLIPLMELRRIPALLSPSGKDHYFFNQVSVGCQSCGREWTLDEMVKARAKKGPVLVSDNETEKEG
mgnify:CR=1 FL=1